MRMPSFLDTRCLRSQFSQRRWVIDTLVAFPCLDASPAMRHHVVASQLSFPAWLTRLQLAVATVCHVLMLFNMRRPQTRREQVAGLCTVSTSRLLGGSLYSDHCERVAPAEAGTLDAL